MRLLPLVLFAATGWAQHIVDLSQQEWTLSGPNVTVPGSVPSNVHLDLLSAGVIDDPLYGYNDVALLWVQRSNWTYESSELHLNRDPGRSTWLVFDGIDTFASINLCDQFVGVTDNQFRQWYFDVTEIVHSCNRTLQLSLNFGSASKIVQDIASSEGEDTEEFCCKQYMRKEQSDFGWDWAPKISPAGIWQPARVVQLGNASPIHIRNTNIDIFRQGQINNIPPDQSQPWIFNASIDFLGSIPQNAAIHLTLEDADGLKVLDEFLKGVYHSDETITGTILVDSNLVDLWYPSGLGSQPLYNAHLCVVSGNSDLARVQRRVGFRTIVLNLLPITEEQQSLGIAPGSNFHFEVNGHQFYAKGSNLVPPDVFWPRVNETTVRNLFEAVVIGNQNMLRVWSSGAYLAGWIYDIADEMGIFLWSEFQFSDSPYPATEDYLAQYEAEATYQVRRVNHHPSLALWAGGNELEQIMLNYYFSPTNPGDILLEYQQIFMEILIKIVYANTRSISYIPSSTYHGFSSLDFNSTMPQVPRYLNSSGPNYIYADTDMYNYNASQAFDIASYEVGRFAAEFGFISMPSVQGWQQAVPEDQLSLYSDMVVHHNRHYPFEAPAGLTDEELSVLGLEEMAAGVTLWYPIPDFQDPVANFSAWCWTTQVFQADYYTSQLAFYRRGSAMPERTLGSLYWQLEDLWTAPTWSSIEADGRWKVLFYRAKDIFSPVIGYPYYNATTGDLEIWVTSDRWTRVQGTAELTWMDWGGNLIPEISTPGSIEFSVGAVNSTLILQTNMLNEYDGLDLSDIILRIEIETEELDQETYSHTSFFHPEPLKAAALQDPGLQFTYDEDVNNFNVIATQGVAAWVWLDHPAGVQGHFSDNGFWLASGENKTVQFTVKQDWTNGEWWSDVAIRSIWNNTLVG